MHAFDLMQEDLDMTANNEGHDGYQGDDVCSEKNGSVIDHVEPARLHSHPLNGALFGRYDDEEYLALYDDIKRNRVLDPVWAMPDGTLLSGHTRIMIAKKLGLATVPVIWHQPLDEFGQVSLLISSNTKRRQINMEERKKIASIVLAKYPEKSDREIAGICGVTHPVIGTIRKGMVREGSLLETDTRIARNGKKYKSKRAVRGNNTVHGNVPLLHESETGTQLQQNNTSGELRVTEQRIQHDGIDMCTGATVSPETRLRNAFTYRANDFFNTLKEKEEQRKPLPDRAQQKKDLLKKLLEEAYEQLDYRYPHEIAGSLVKKFVMRRLVDPAIFLQASQDDGGLESTSAQQMNLSDE